LKRKAEGGMEIADLKLGDGHFWPLRNLVKEFIQSFQNIRGVIIFFDFSVQVMNM
jgi:hypothetical protein